MRSPRGAPGALEEEWQRRIDVRESCLSPCGALCHGYGFIWMAPPKPHWVVGGPLKPHWVVGGPPKPHWVADGPFGGWPHGGCVTGSGEWYCISPLISFLGNSGCGWLTHGLETWIGSQGKGGCCCRCLPCGAWASSAAPPALEQQTGG